MSENAGLPPNTDKAGRQDILPNGRYIGLQGGRCRNHEAGKGQNQEGSPNRAKQAGNKSQNPEARKQSYKAHGSFDKMAAEKGKGGWFMNCRADWG